ncbi:glycosyltransferase family 4 protein [Gammaproteobacteria bacterium]|nr:glycosyltransferase family 4 protein [Gammaproteobacteria bacterium]
MRIIYLHQYFNTPNMSGGTRSYEMAKRMVLKGHDVHMITSSREPTKNRSWVTTDIDGIKVHWLPVEYTNKMSFHRRIKSFFQFAIKSSLKAASIKADIIFATSTPLTIALPAVYASKKQNIPVVFEVRDLWPEMPIAMGALKNPITIFLAKMLEKFAYKNSVAINALSPGMKDGIIARGFPSSNISVIPNSSDISMFRVGKESGLRFRKARPWLGKDNPILLYTGTFGLINDLTFLVEIAFELSKINSKIKILAIGGGIRFDEIKDYAKNLGVLNENFFMEGYLKKKDVPSAMSAATMTSSLFLDKPEMQKNSSNKFFDSLASAKPIMINYGGWMHDLIKEHKCGLAMWKVPHSEIAIELNNKVYDKDWLAAASLSSAKLAEESFDRDVLAGQLIELLESAVNGNANKAESIAPGMY